MAIPLSDSHAAMIIICYKVLLTAQPVARFHARRVNPDAGFNALRWFGGASDYMYAEGY